LTYSRALTGAHAMIRDVLDRSILVAAAIAVATIGSASLAHADPECPSGSCTHGASHSPSYQNGYSSEHDFYSIPKNHEYLKSEMRDGYNAGLVCQVEINGGPQPPSVTDWISGCVDALHDLGFKP
jgi:hypothetical protein